MENKIHEDENLFRAIKRSKPDWMDNFGKPTPAMYKDKGGNSVDRDDKRDENEIIEFMENGIFKGRLKGVVKVNAGKCMKAPILARVAADPKDNNPYHANIFIDEDEKRSSLQALMLADSSVVVYLNESMNWVYI